MVILFLISCNSEQFESFEFIWNVDEILYFTVLLHLTQIFIPCYKWPGMFFVKKTRIIYGVQDSNFKFTVASITGNYLRPYIVLEIWGKTGSDEVEISKPIFRWHCTNCTVDYLQCRYSPIDLLWRWKSLDASFGQTLVEPGILQK